MIDDAAGRNISLNFRSWHEADLPRSHRDVCLSRQTGKHLLGVSLSAFDPVQTFAFEKLLLRKTTI